jgi:hypothetical protein
MIKKPRFLSVLMLIAAVFAILVGTVSAQTIVVVTPVNTQGWYPYLAAGGHVNYIDEATSPHPPGSLQFVTANTVESVAEYIRDVNVPLASVTELGYSTKQVSGPAYASATFHLIVDLNGSGLGGETALLFEPYWQNGGIGDPAPVVPGV